VYGYILPHPTENTPYVEPFDEVLASRAVKNSTSRFIRSGYSAVGFPVFSVVPNTDDEVDWMLDERLCCVDVDVEVDPAAKYVCPRLVPEEGEVGEGILACFVCLRVL